MLISLNWLRDFVDIPDGTDMPALAERFTMTCAEVEGIERIEVGAQGLIVARVVAHQDLAGTRNLRLVQLDVGDGRIVETISAAPHLPPGSLVVFAPPGAGTKATGPIGVGQVAGRQSFGMILPGDALGIALAAGEAVFCPPAMKPGEAIDPGPLDDWVIEIDNKSITHRPDLWGHYGIAREIAAMTGNRLRPYPVVNEAELCNPALPAVPIEIDEPQRCPRYTGLMFTGVRSQPAPLWMQFRLGHVGMRPIDCLVDLTNFIMAELGQPMHAFDGGNVDRIEVAVAEPGSRFTTLDGVERTLPPGALMIMSHRRPVAMAGIMGGQATEVTASTQKLLLESANFEPAGIRRCAAALGLRTEASARFEKSLDPAHTVLAVQRFLHLARPEYPDLTLTSTLSDCYPLPLPNRTVEVRIAVVDRFLGRPIGVDRMTSILQALAFGVEKREDRLVVSVPSFRATKDISLEVDLIEEIARCVGYDNIEPALPNVAVRCFEPNAQHRIERDTLRTFCQGLGYCEVQLYIWHDDAWLNRLGLPIDSAIELRNPPAAGQSRLRHELLPGLLQACDLNRLHFDAFRLCEIGSAFPGGADSTAQQRRLGLIVARRGKEVEDDLLGALKGDIENWAWQVLGAPAAFVPAADAPLPLWAHEYKTARVAIGPLDSGVVGIVSVVPLALRRTIDEHLGAWGLAWAEIQLEPLTAVKPHDARLRPVPEFPEVQLDFSLLAPAATLFGEVCERLTRFQHPLLRRLTFVGAYAGKSVPQGRRSLTFRTQVSAADRTLVDQDLTGFRAAFAKHLADCGFELRTGG